MSKFISMDIPCHRGYKSQKAAPQYDGKIEEGYDYQDFPNTLKKETCFPAHMCTCRHTGHQRKNNLLLSNSARSCRPLYSMLASAVFIPTFIKKTILCQAAFFSSPQSSGKQSVWISFVLKVAQNSFFLYSDNPAMFLILPISSPHKTSLPRASPSLPGFLQAPVHPHCQTSFHLTSLH